jgi:hypothetical protein
VRKPSGGERAWFLEEEREQLDMGKIPDEHHLGVYTIKLSPPNP